MNKILFNNKPNLNNTNMNKWAMSFCSLYIFNFYLTRIISIAMILSVKYHSISKDQKIEQWNGDNLVTPSRRTSSLIWKSYMDKKSEVIDIIPILERSTCICIISDSPSAKRKVRRKYIHFRKERLLIMWLIVGELCTTIAYALSILNKAQLTLISGKPPATAGTLET